MKSFGTITIFLCAITLASCKKDQLEGQKSILIGTWDWTESYEVSNHCEPDSLWNYLLVDSAESDNRYALEFQEKGKLIFYTNDRIIWNQRIVFDSDNTIDDSPYQHHFVILLNNRRKDEMEVWVGEDSLLVLDFPKDTDDDCSEMFNHYTRK